MGAVVRMGVLVERSRKQVGPKSMISWASRNAMTLGESWEMRSAGACLATTGRSMAVGHLPLRIGSPAGLSLVQAPKTSERTAATSTTEGEPLTGPAFATRMEEPLLLPIITARFQSADL